MGIIYSCGINKFEEEEFQTISSIRQKSKMKFESINDIDSNEEKLKKFKEAIELDNTNKIIIQNYIIFLKDIKFSGVNSEIQKYFLFFENVKNGKKEIFNFFDKLINYNQSPKDKLDFFQYLIEELAFFNGINYKNNLPFLKNYDNLYFTKLYSNLIKLFLEKYKRETEKENIESLIKQCKNSIEFYKKKMKEENLEEKYYKVTLNEIDKILSCEFFQIYILFLSKFMKTIIPFIDYLKNESIVSYNKNALLEKFIFYISKREFKEIDNPIISNENYCFNDSVIDTDSQIKLYSKNKISITRPNSKNGNIVYIKYGNWPEIELDNEIYSVGYACNKIENQKGICTNFQKLKFSCFDANNIFRKNWDNIKKDIKDIFGSDCMKSLIRKKNLFDLFNYNNQELLDEILNNVYFYPFFSEDSYANFNEDLQTIHLQGITKDELNSIEYIIVIYAFILVCLIHELFHFFFSYMRFICKDKKRFLSPLPNNASPYAAERKGESGEWIEELLFGRHIEELSTKEGLFIFGMKNYKDGFNNYRKDFEKCNKIDNNEMGIENIRKYFENFEKFESFKLENKEFCNKIFKFSNKKKLHLSVGEDIFFERYPSSFKNKLDSIEKAAIFQKYMKKYLEIKNEIK